MRRVLFLGQKPVGESCFDLLLKSELEVCGVVSNIAENGWWGTGDIVKKAGARNIPYYYNNRPVNDQIKKLIKCRRIDLILCVQHPWILPKEILEAVDYQAFNLHNGKLPEQKGCNAVNHSILDGAKTHYSTLHWMVEEVDAGNIIMCSEVEIEAHDTAKSLYEKTCISCTRLFEAFLSCLEANVVNPGAVQVGESHFYPRNSLDECREIRNAGVMDFLEIKSRALYFPPFEPAYIVRSGAKFYILPEATYDPL